MYSYSNTFVKLCIRIWIHSQNGVFVFIFVFMTLQNSCIRIRFHFNVFNPMSVTQCCFNIGPASKTVGQHWNSIGWMTRVCAKPWGAMGCDAGPTLNQNMVCRPTFSVQVRRMASIKWMLASTGDGRNTRWRYIKTSLLGSFLNYMYIGDFTLISWTFRILANTPLCLENIKHPALVVC